VCAVDAVIRDAVCPSFREVSEEADSALRPQIQRGLRGASHDRANTLNYYQRETLTLLGGFSGEDIVSEE
jgi:hypothetical protein